MRQMAVSNIHKFSKVVFFQEGNIRGTQKKVMSLQIMKGDVLLTHCSAHCFVVLSVVFLEEDTKCVIPKGTTCCWHQPNFCGFAFAFLHVQLEHLQLLWLPLVK